ncbi:MAG: hypothetical protein LIO79_09780 [Rikenellaceae bacterium]|nr:hypothetical protein [Rikenellaceae bacterium]
MNKLMGFFELNEMNLPSIPWKEYTGKEVLASDVLWTIRSAVYQGNDLNLPRLVGVKSKEATEFGDDLLKKLKNKGIVIYYPFFFARKSGNLEVRSDRIIIEAVKGDLWNMVTYSSRDVTIQYTPDETLVNGNQDFLTEKEQALILKYVKEVRNKFRDDLLEGKSVLLEWSLANMCNIDKTPVGEEYLVFYEVRTV